MPNINSGGTAPLPQLGNVQKPPKASPAEAAARAGAAAAAGAGAAAAGAAKIAGAAASTMAATSGDAVNAVARNAAEFAGNSVGDGIRGAKTEKVADSFEANAAQIKDKLSNSNADDLTEIKMFVVMNSGLSKQESTNLMTKLVKSDKYDNELKGFIDAFKGHPNPEEALKNLTKSLAGGAVNVLNDDPGC